jgi:hypothetical protein
MQSDGNFVIYRGDWWESSGPSSLAMWSLLDQPGYRASLEAEKVLPGSVSAWMDIDGRFLMWHMVGSMFDISPRYLPGGCWAVMQDDGNFCIKLNGDITKKPTFCTGVTDTLDEKNIELTEMVYDFKNAIVKPIAGPKQSASNTAINKTEINQSSTLILSYTVSTATGWKTSTSLKIGARTSIKVGVPLIADGKVELSTELTQGFEWNETTTKSEAKTIDLPVVVPPGQGVIGKLTWSTSSITVPFRVKGTGTFNSGKKAPISLNGVYEGIATHDIYTKWIPYTEGEEHSARAMLLAAPSTVLP